MSDSEKWIVHIIGPDDVIPQENELTALQYANAVNKTIASEVERISGGPFMIAVAKTTLDLIK